MNKLSGHPLDKMFGAVIDACGWLPPILALPALTLGLIAFLTFAILLMPIKYWPKARRPVRPIKPATSLTE